MIVRCGEQWAGDGQLRLDKDWTRLDRISPRLVEAVIASEDQRFFDHHGFDMEAIVSAFAINRGGKRKLGASTISQQTAKNLFLWPTRSWTRKALEAYFTFLIELLWSKRRILETYLNIIETGDGVYGAEAAARRYFGVSAGALTREQSALIAAILPNPRNWSPARPSTYLQRRQTWILRQMRHLGPLPSGLYASGTRSAEPSPRRRAPAASTMSRSRAASTKALDSVPPWMETPELQPVPVPPDSPSALPPALESALDDASEAGPVPSGPDTLLPPPIIPEPPSEVPEAGNPAP